MTRVALALLAVLSLSGCFSVSTPPDERTDFARHRLAAEEALVHVTDPALSKADQLEWARRAVGHADRAIELEPERVEGHFYRAVGMGYVFERSNLSAVGRVGDLEQAALRARELDPAFEHGGPLRYLAMLYWKSPAWPAGPEDAGEHEVIEPLFLEAVEIAPLDPENHLRYAQYLFERGRNDDALGELRAAREALPGAEGLPAHERKQLEDEISELGAALSG